MGLSRSLVCFLGVLVKHRFLNKKTYSAILLAISNADGLFDRKWAVKAHFSNKIFIGGFVNIINH
jgi:hypothetical protein